MVLCSRYQNNATTALKHFNLARKDNRWGEEALYNMVEICLNPDSDIVGGETFESPEDANSAEKQDSEQVRCQQLFCEKGTLFVVNK